MTYNDSMFNYNERKKYKDKSRMLGDRNASKCILIPLKELFNKENIA